MSTDRAERVQRLKKKRDNKKKSERREREKARNVERKRKPKRREKRREKQETERNLCTVAITGVRNGCSLVQKNDGMRIKQIILSYLKLPLARRMTERN